MNKTRLVPVYSESRNPNRRHTRRVRPIEVDPAGGGSWSRAMVLAAIAALLAAAVLATGCSSSSGASRGDAESGTTEAAVKPSSAAPGAVGRDFRIEVLEGPADTAGFHIGAPVFIKMTLPGGSICGAHNGYPFFFDASGAQLGWGFEEITDSLLFPEQRERCERILMLSSEKSNRLAEGVFSLRVELFIDEKTTLGSNTILLYPKRSQGADEMSYTRFLLEQIVRNTELLKSDPETVAALFADGVPASAESEVYRAVILYRMGNLDGAMRALERSSTMAAERGMPLNESAELTRTELAGRMQLTSAAEE